MDENLVEIDSTDEILGIEDLPEDDSGDSKPYESTDSPLHTTKRTYKGGNKRKDEAPIGLSAPPIPIPVPRPKFRIYKTDSAAKDQRPISFLNWWNGLPSWAKDQTVAYVYREHPVLLDLVDENGKKLDFKYIDKIIGTEPMQDELDFLHRYGCGSYKVMFNEAEPRKGVDKTKTLCEVYVTNVGGGDYRSNPPTDRRISEVEQVDLDNPANTAYISFLRGQGKLPEQQNSRQTEGDMAQVQIIEKLTDKMVQMAENTSTGKNKDAGVLQDAMKGAMDVMQKGAEAAIKTTQEANDYAARVRNEAEANRPTPTPSENPMSMALEIVKLIHSERTPNQGSDARFDELQRQFSQLQQSQIDRLTKQVETLLEAKVTGPAASTSPFSAMNEGLESLEKFNGVMDRLRNSKEDAGEDAVVDAVADAAPKWMRPFLPILPGLAQGVLAYLQQRGQQPQPAYYQTPDGRILPMMQPQVIQPQQQIQAPPMQWNGPGVRSTQFGPQPVPSPASAPDTDPIYQLLQSITIPLLNNLQVNGTGTDFADWFVGGYGQAVYEDVVQLGPETLFTAISTFPPINTNPIYGQVPVERVREFVTEFCDPKWDEEGDEPEKVSEPGTGPVPA